MTARVVIILAFLVGAFGCGCNGPDPFIPDGTTRIIPPPEYRLWWEASRACIHLPEYRTYESIEWYWSPSDLTASDGTDAVGLTIKNRIYLAAGVAMTPWVVQHELVHAINLLGANPHPKHPFYDCGLMVNTPHTLFVPDGAE